MIFCVIVGGCSAKSQIPTALESEKVFLYHVSAAREDLETIAGWFTGTPQNWRRILSYNGSIHPYALKIGDTVRIPEQLIVRFDPIGEEYIKKNKHSSMGLRRRRQKSALSANSIQDSVDPASPQSDVEDTAGSSPQQDQLIENLLPRKIR